MGRLAKSQTLGESQPILDYVCCHIKHHPLFELGVCFVGDGNDIRQ
jgi:hypothetical protein